VAADELDRTEQLADLANHRDAIHAALAKLSTALADAVQFRVIEELSYDDVARELGCSPAAARQRVARGLTQLANRFGGSSMSPSDVILDRVEAQLVAGIAGHQRRRRQRVRVAAAAMTALLAVAAVIAGPGLDGEGPRTALAITADADSLTVSVQDATADPARMTRELVDAGANVRVESVPVTSDAIGHWIASGVLGPASPADAASITAQLADQIRKHPDVLTIPKHSGVKLWLIVGRTAAQGGQPCTTLTAVRITADGSPCSATRRAESASTTR
jgi:hypothetical protein